MVSLKRGIFITSAIIQFFVIPATLAVGRQGRESYISVRNFKDIPDFLPKKTKTGSGMTTLF